MMPTNTHCCRLSFSLLFFFHPIYYLRPSFSLPPSGNSDRGSHSRLFSPPTHYGSCLAFFIARRFQIFLPSSTRVQLYIMYTIYFSKTSRNSFTCEAHHVRPSWAPSGSPCHTNDTMHCCNSGHRFYNSPQPLNSDRCSVKTQNVMQWSESVQCVCAPVQMSVPLLLYHYYYTSTILLLLYYYYNTITILLLNTGNR